MPVSRTMISGVSSAPRLFSSFAWYRPPSSTVIPLIVRLLPFTVYRVPLPTLNTTPSFFHTTVLTVPATSSGSTTVPPN